METVTLNVKGMTCNGCVNSVKRVLSGVPGIENAEVSLEKAQATIRYDAAKADIAQFRSAIQGAGFEVVG